MLENEAVIIQGFEQFSKYKGYNRTLEFDGDCKDDPTLDEHGNIQTSLLAIDAVPYRFMKTGKAIKKQYTSKFYLQEMNKAYAGFIQSKAEMRMEDEGVRSYDDASWLVELDPKYPRPIATGNWGCGAFGGDPQFKAMLQWIAASCSPSPGILFYTFKQPRVKLLRDVVEKISSEKWTVKQLFTHIADFARRAYATKSKQPPGYFDIVLGTKSMDDMGDGSDTEETLPATLDKSEKEAKSGRQLGGSPKQSHSSVQNSETFW